MGKKTPIIEVFGPTIQGEGALIGAPTLFLRTGGCNYRCTWCDTLFAVLPEEVKKNATYMTFEEITSKIEEFPWTPYMTISGGDPCMHKGLGDVVAWLKTKYIQVAIETQGELWQDWLLNCDYVTFSPKPPSSGNITDIPQLVQKCIKLWRTVRHITIKPVIFNEADLQYAIDALNAFRSASGGVFDTFCFQAGTIHEEMVEQESAKESVVRDKRNQILESQAWLIDRLKAKQQEQPDLFDWRTRILPQLHAAIWPAIKQGV